MSADSILKCMSFYYNDVQKSRLKEDIKNYGTNYCSDKCQWDDNKYSTIDYVFDKNKPFTDEERELFNSKFSTILKFKPVVSDFIDVLENFVLSNKELIKDYTERYEKIPKSDPFKLLYGYFYFSNESRTHEIKEKFDIMMNNFYESHKDLLDEFPKPPGSEHDPKIQKLWPSAFVTFADVAVEAAISKDNIMIPLGKIACSIAQEISWGADTLLHFVYNNIDGKGGTGKLDVISQALSCLTQEVCIKLDSFDSKYDKKTKEITEGDHGKLSLQGIKEFAMNPLKLWNNFDDFLPNLNQEQKNALEMLHIVNNNPDQAICIKGKCSYSNLITIPQPENCKSVSEDDSQLSKAIHALKVDINSIEICDVL